ncbi:zinc finger protein 609-like isoform X1 [Sinocyclocheilus grahami]|uniref:Zinc finger protein 609-like n=2 Tax=Sinocyclocheilus grahami TaxID=75366 RepID=A0A672P2U4_SINGR|nr:PREDICTED: zinc finger protein 609-like isoform X1 [Sinocyclocheilus grahami]XP_016114951.1 PREDICTED: zinc finger protein 609-like isoform X1 [Sinocyclocheilus grahami]XP_016114952.1 PREDICTED: zinc finger protein 609-like isoform X1 [Sinocyclocheilus grahami]XP_016114953.1 PREDICTED: zinc finger protein 609-like isoform X1 [Sinocyclocheilus grahami]
MSLSSGTAGGKGVDLNAVDTYDSGDEWEIGVGNLIIDLDADLEKDKLEMSGTKDGDGMAAASSAVAALPDNIKFINPVPPPPIKDSKSKAKRSKNSKDSSKSSTPDGAKKDAQGRAQNEATGPTVGSGSTTLPSGKGSDKSNKASRNVQSGKKDKEGSGKSKKDKNEGVQAGSVPTEKDPSAQVMPLGQARNTPFEGTQNLDLVGAEQLGNITLDTTGIVTPLAIKSEPEEVENNDCRTMKKVKSEKMESPVSTPAPPPLHLLAPVGISDISSSCEQIMVRTRSVAVSTSDVALATEPECLGPCEPGTSVNLEGIVWQETEDGMLVVNVTWRNKTYVGTLLDCTRHDWAPPRFCESPTSDLEMRNGRGRGKRMRPNSNTPVNENSNSSDNKGSNNSKTRAASNSKGRRGSQNSSERRTPPNSNTEDVKASPSSANKRKNKPASDMEPNSSSEDTKGSKRMRTNSNSGIPHTILPLSNIKAESLPPSLDRSCPSPVLIDCPHPNCNKKYKHINGLKYHQARAHNDDDIKLDIDGDSEYGEDSTLHPEPGSCNGASISQKGCASPARSVTPKGRGFDAQSPSPSSGKFSSKQPGKKKPEAEHDSGVPMDGGEDGPCLTDETSNDGIDDKRGLDKAKKSGSGTKADKLAQKAIKSARPLVPSLPPQQLYALPTSGFPAPNSASSSSIGSVVQSISKSPQIKTIQTKPAVMGDPSLNPALGSSKDKKKKDKKKKEGSKEGDSPKAPGKGGKPEGGKSPYSESSDQGSKSEGLLNGSTDPHQSRLASMKAEADKIYSFSDNSPSPSIGVASRIESGGMAQPLTPLHVVTQNGADNSSVKTNSPAYSDISDAGEDGEGKVEGVKVKSEDQAGREGAKKSLFPSQPPNKDSCCPGYETYYSPNYGNRNPSPGVSNTVPSLQDGAVKVKKEEDPEPGNDKGKSEPPEDRKPDIGASSQQPQQPSVIQQRSSMFMQPLYYNQYAYVPPYGYSPDQAYHNHLMNTNPAYRQQCEDRQRQAAEQHRAAERKSEAAQKDREASMKSEEWKQKASVPPTLSKAPSLSDLGKPSPQGKPKDPSEPGKSVIIPKGEDGKGQTQQSEGLKMKLSEAGHHAKDEQKPGHESGRSAVEQAMYMYRQEPDSRLWPYVYPSKYPDAQKQIDEERWKEERDRERERDRDRDRDRERDRKGKDERQRSKDAPSREECKEGPEPRTSSASEEHRVIGKDPRAHMQFSSHLPQHQSYMSYMHGYPYGQGYDHSHPGYRGMPTVMMQNYPGSYLSPGYSFSPYGNRMPPGEEGEKARASPTVSGKSASESKALDILHQHASQYKSKSPTVGEKTPHERDRSGSERERDGERPRSSPSQRIMPSHHHLGYSLLPGQYDLSYATGISSSAIVASQQASAPSLYPPARR